MVHFDVASIGSFLIMLAALIAAGGIVGGMYKKAYVAVLRETADGWKSSHEQVKSRLDTLTEEYAEQKKRSREQDERERQCQQLNYGLQIQIKDKDATIERQQGEINLLKLQVQHLENRDATRS